MLVNSSGSVVTSTTKITADAYYYWESSANLSTLSESYSLEESICNDYFLDESPVTDVPSVLDEEVSPSEDVIVIEDESKLTNDESYVDGITPSEENEVQDSSDTFIPSEEELLE